MAKQVTDEEAGLKRQARRRLIGAVALVTAVAVILPMVLDSEPKPAGVDIELRIPDKDKVAAFQPEQAPVVPAAVASQPVSAPVAAEPQAAPTDTIIAPAPVAEPAPVAPAAKPEVQSAAKPELKPAAKPEQKPAPKAETKSESRPETKSPAKSDVASPAKSEGGKPSFVLQVGAYANAEIAKDWQVKLKKQGFHAYTEPAGARTRLRVGPFGTHEAADTARQKLQGLGLHPDLLDMGSK
jgi:DedD protein